MVALLHPQSTFTQSARPASPSHLRLVRGPAAPKHPWVHWVQERPRRAAMWAVVGLAVIGSFLVLRSLQAVPASAYQSGASSASVHSLAGDGEAVHVVQQGETLWAIASELAPGVDPRPLIDQLADRNGGSAIQVGQRLLVPADLVD